MLYVILSVAMSIAQAPARRVRRSVSTSAHTAVAPGIVANRVHPAWYYSFDTVPMNVSVRRFESPGTLRLVVQALQVHPQVLGALRQASVRSAL